MPQFSTIMSPYLKNGAFHKVTIEWKQEIIAKLSNVVISNDLE